MKGNNLVQLNDKGIVAICMIILISMFGLGFMTSEAKRVDAYQPEFTVDDAKRLVQLQAIEDSKVSGGAEVYATKDENGELIVYWSDKKIKLASKH